jgi:hypothetical protein
MLEYEKQIYPAFGGIKFPRRLITYYLIRFLPRPAF